MFVLFALASGCARKPPSKDAADGGSLVDLGNRCERGDDDACIKLADAYHEQGVSKDPKSKARVEELARRRAVLERACSRGQGKALSCVQLAGAYMDNFERMPDNEAMAQRVSLRACDGGQPTACSFLGFLKTEILERSPDNLEQGRSLYERGCTGGDGWGYVKLARVFQEGFGTRRDPARARSLLGRACQLGDDAICKEIGKR